MNIRPAIIDTSVLISGLITQQADAPTRVLAAAMVSGVLRFIVSDELLAEYLAVLARPAIRRLHGLTAPELRELLTTIAAHAAIIQPPRGPAAPDPGDTHLWDLLRARPDAVLVTGDRRLLEATPPAGKVRSPREFVDSLRR